MIDNHISDQNFYGLCLRFWKKDINELPIAWTLDILFCNFIHLSKIFSIFDPLNSISLYLYNLKFFNFFVPYNPSMQFAEMSYICWLRQCFAFHLIACTLYIHMYVTRSIYAQIFTYHCKYITSMFADRYTQMYAMCANKYMHQCTLHMN